MKLSILFIDLVFDSQGSEANALQVSFYEPDGSLVFSQNAGIDRGPFLLERSGTYTLTVQCVDGTATGTFQFQVGAVTDATDLAFNTPLTGTLAAGQQVIYQFSTPTALNLYFDGLDPDDDIRVQLLSPNGKVYFDRDTDENSSILNVPEGTYALLVTNTATRTSDYQFQLHDIDASPFLSLDATTDGQLAPGNGSHIYQLNGLDGQRFFFDSLTSNSIVQWELYGPGNQLLQSNTLNKDFELVLPANGQYTLVIEGGQNPNPVDYRFGVSVSESGTETLLLPGEGGELVPADESSSVQFSYDPVFNQLTSFIDELGHQILYDIDPTNGNVLSETQVVGEIGGEDDLVTVYAYTNYGLLDLMTDPLGRITDYDYDVYGNLTQVTYAQGTANEVVQQFEYDLAGNVTAFIDENGNRTEFEYDLHNRLVTVIEADPDGDGPLTSPVTTYTYDAVGNQNSMTDARGYTTAYRYDELDRLTTVIDPLGGEMLYEYDSAGNLIALTDELGHTTEYGYDERNRLTVLTDPAGNSFRFDYDVDDNLIFSVDPLGNTTQFAYDARDRLTTQVDAQGQSALYRYDLANNLVLSIDENGHATQFAYDDLNRLTTVTDPLGGQYSYGYDKAYNLIASTDELGRTTTYAYDELDRLTTVTDPLDGVETYSYDAVGNLTAFTDELGRTYTYAYDNLNRLESITDPLDQTISYGYDAEFNLTSYTDGLGNTTQYDYDALDRLVTETNALGDTVTTLYDAVDNVVAVTDELGRTTTITYNERDLQTDITDPLGNTTTIEYDTVGLVTAVIDPLGQTTSYGYDSLYRQTSYTDGLGQTTFYTYDPVGNLLSITDPEANTTTYSYDGLDRLVTETNELGDTRSYSYDAVDNLTGMVDRNGRETAYVYDALDRQTQEIWLDDFGNSIHTFDYTYDAASQLAAVSDPNSAYSYTYDLASRLTSVDNAGTFGVPNVVLDYTYDAANNMLTVTDTISGQLSGIEAFTYDELNRVTSITQSGNGVTDRRVDMAYDAASQMTEVIRYSDLGRTQLVAKSDYVYDAAGRLTDLTHGQGAIVLADYEWVYDEANRITQFTSLDGVSEYGYDERDQLTGADHSYQGDEAYSYDENGNRTTDGYETGTNNQLLSDGIYTYEYDAEGNRTKQTEIATGEVVEYSWDHRDRLTAVVTKDSSGAIIESVTYTYDAFDRRIEKSVDADGDGPGQAEVERFVYDGDHIALVFDGQGNQTHRYLHGPQIDQVLAEETADGQVQWALTDNQGTVRDLIDSSGNLLNHISYDSFGNVTAESNPEVDFRFGYTGREVDEESGLYYYRARYFDPGVGEFISEDPIGFAGGDVNFYRYVGNSSTNYLDSVFACATSA